MWDALLACSRVKATKIALLGEVEPMSVTRVAHELIEQPVEVVEYDGF